MHICVYVYTFEHKRAYLCASAYVICLPERGHVGSRVCADLRLPSDVMLCTLVSI